MTGRVWAYIGAILGGLVSVAANVAHSFVPPDGAPNGWAPELGAVVFSVVWPVFLLVAVEVWARVPWPAGWRYALIRFGGLLPVALVAAVVSYRHLSGLLAHYGEDPLTVVIGPLAVDGLMVMATGALIATGRQTASNDVNADILASEVSGAISDVNGDIADQRERAVRDASNVATPAAVTVHLTEWPGSMPWPAETPEIDDGDDEDGPEDDAANDASSGRPRKSPARERIARVRARYPEAGQEEVARRAGASVRTVQRNWDLTTPDSEPVNGRQPHLVPTP